MLAMQWQTHSLYRAYIGHPLRPPARLEVVPELGPIAAAAAVISQLVHSSAMGLCRFIPPCPVCRQGHVATHACTCYLAAALTWQQLAT